MRSSRNNPFEDSEMWTQALHAQNDYYDRNNKLTVFSDTRAQNIKFRPFISCSSTSTTSITEFASLPPLMS